MDIVYYIIIPIITSILGGLVGGLFTFLGVKLTLKDERERHEEELRLKIKDKNKEIIENRPILKAIKNPVKTLAMQQTVYVVPFGEPELLDEKNIIFHYPKEFEDKENWESYSVLLKNIGRKRIVRSFLQTDYENKINLYTKYELNNWNHPIYGKHFFIDSIMMSGHLAPDEILELRIFYPKDYPQLKKEMINIYFEDEHGNKWTQYFINNDENDTSSFSIISDLKYHLYLKKEMTTFFLYNQMFYNKKIKKSFKYNKDKFEESLLNKILYWKKFEDKITDFENDFRNGNIELENTYRNF